MVRKLAKTNQPQGYGAVLDMEVPKFRNIFRETKQNYMLD